MKLGIAFAAAFFAAACVPSNQVNPRVDSEMPRKILWAWERPEDLRFIDPNEFGVAFLAQTIFLENDRVSPRGRRQPLEVARGTYLIAVTRIETNKETSGRPKLDQVMAVKTAALIRNTLDLPDVRAIQVDFDAVVSERGFYRSMMKELLGLLSEPPPSGGRQLRDSSNWPPANAGRSDGVGIPLTMTSLASWCTGDAWFNDFPVDEAVPMVFQMGADGEKIRNYLRNGNDWLEPLCRGSYGVSVDEGPPANIKPGRRLYFFKNDPWRPSDVERLQK